jgi:hypothetical protein
MEAGVPPTGVDQPDRHEVSRGSGTPAGNPRHCRPLDSAASAVLLALHRRTPDHEVYPLVTARTVSRTPSEELARRWYPDVPLRAPLPGTAAFYSSAKALAVLGWDPRVEHPAIAAAECGG